MKYGYKSVSTLLAAVIAISPFTAEAKNSDELQLINHYNQPLTFTVGINPDVLPDFPVNFTIVPNDQLQTRVINLNKEAYIRGEDSNNHSVFFGVDIKDRNVQVHGYIAKGVAYSWKAGTLVFCTPEEYKSKGTCL